MLSIAKSKIFNRYLPISLSVVLIVAAVFVYQIFIQPENIAFAAVSLSQKRASGNSFGANPLSLAFSSNNTAGNTIVVVANWIGASSAALSSVTDSQGNSYSLIPATFINKGPTTNFANITSEMAFATNVKGGANTVSAHWGSAPTYNFLYIYEVSPSVLDQAISTTGVTQNPSAGTVNTIGKGDFGIADAFDDDSAGVGGVFTAGSGWTIDDNSGSGSGSWATEYQIQSNPGSLTGNFTKSNGSNQWIASMATFRTRTDNFVQQGENSGKEAGRCL